MTLRAIAVFSAVMLLSGCSFLNSIGAPDPVAPPAQNATAPMLSPLAPGVRDPWCDIIAGQERDKMAANGGSAQTVSLIYDATYATCVGSPTPLVH